MSLRVGIQILQVHVADPLAVFLCGGGGMHAGQSDVSGIQAEPDMLWIGKSSLVFDTIAAESQRQLNEIYSAYLRNQMPQLPPPRAGRIEYLSPAIVISQKRLGGN